MRRTLSHLSWPLALLVGLVPAAVVASPLLSTGGIDPVADGVTFAAWGVVAAGLLARVQRLPPHR